MVLKKQTVWLITMLSLLIVLSVYYMASPGDDQFAAITDEEEQDKDKENSDNEGKANVDSMDMDVTGISSVDEMFATIRIEREDDYSEMKEQLSNIVASSSSTTEEINEAMEKINDLQATARKESYLEKAIKQEKGYRDVLVRKEEEFVSITVIADELSKSDANNLMQMARDEFGIMDVRVKLQKDDV
ncbi:SpoIIIAH-like family protein [Bacillaceae bacterium W0354]